MRRGLREANRQFSKASVGVLRYVARLRLPRRGPDGPAHRIVRSRGSFASALFTWRLETGPLEVLQHAFVEIHPYLDQTRREQSAAFAESTKPADAIAEMEREPPPVADERARKADEFERRELKTRLSAQAVLEQELRRREHEVAQALSVEQARWVELNARLDDLERLLVPVPALAPAPALRGRTATSSHGLGVCG